MPFIRIVLPTILFFILKVMTSNRAQTAEDPFAKRELRPAKRPQRQEGAGSLLV
jgi:hypothetical protein